MAALINALDNYTPKQVGENGHVEYGWSNNIREKIVQISFQITRTDENGCNSLKKQLHNILHDLKYKLSSSSTSIFEKEVTRAYLSILYRMIGHTRDIIDGKGEYTLTYMMIHTWYEFYPELACFALKCLVDLGDKNIHQYGSWKDIKYFCEYCKNNGASIDHPLIQYAIKLTNEQLRNDSNESGNNISLVAKWIPREKSSFNWLYQALACDYYSEFLVTANNPEKGQRAILKCKTQYRKLLSELNKKIDTLQIKQCAKTWSTIDFDKVTSISLSKQKKAFLNTKKNGEVKYPYDNDRILCAEHFNDHIQRSIKGEIEMKGKRIGLNNFTKQALGLLDNSKITPNIQLEIDLLNSQWINNSTQTGNLGNMIAMVDVSGSMDGDPLYAAIALGIRVAEKSILGKRVMTFSSNPKWVNLEPYNDFVSQVKALNSAEWGMNTNFHKALDMILDAIIENNMKPEDVQDLMLVIFSDMQIDCADRSSKTELYDSIKEKYSEAGIRVHGKPYKPPHIVFWNLRSTSGFPTLSTQSNVSMMSGFSPSLLNLFCEQGLEALQSCTPWSQLEKSLENERYKIMERKFKELIA